MATEVTGLVMDAIEKMAFTGIAISCAASSLPAAPSRARRSRPTMRATTPGASPRLTALLSWRDSAALSESENPFSSVSSARLERSEFVWASPEQTNDPVRAMNAAERMAILCSFKISYHACSRLVGAAF